MSGIDEVEHHFGPEKHRLCIRSQRVLSFLNPIIKEIVQIVGEKLPSFIFFLYKFFKYDKKTT
jgi:hypothetical protein